MTTADLGINTGAGALAFQLASEFSKVSRRKQVMGIQTPSHLFRCAGLIPWLRLDFDGRFPRQ